MKLATSSNITVTPAIENKALANTFTTHLLCLEKILAILIPKGNNLSTWIDQTLPLIYVEEEKKAPCILPVHLICVSNENIEIEKLFFNTLQQDLLFEKKILITTFLYMPFRFSIKDKIFFYAKAEIIIENNNDLSCAVNNISTIKEDFLSKISGQKIDQRKSLPKKILINSDLKKLLEKRPSFIDNNIFSEASRLSILAPHNFEDLRSHRHLSRIICSLYLLRKSLRKQIHLNPEKRHLQIRFLLATLFFTFGEKPSLGLSIGLNLFNKKELLEEEHIESALQKWISKAQIVKDSFYSYKNSQDQICTIYLEIEKKDGSKFLLNEIKKLRKNLPEELKGHIEKGQSPIFFIPNEEETIRDILHLNHQFKTLSDLPQITLSFLKQTETELLFQLILVRVVKKDTNPLEKLLKSYLNFSIVRTQTVGYLRKKYPKEVYVLEIILPKDPSLFRNDSSINIYLARSKILSKLTKAVGEVRDFNGGLLLKQMELFSQFKDFFSAYSRINPDLLDDFFYSITPIEAQAVSPLENLTFLFEILLNLKEDAAKKEQPYHIVFEEKDAQIFTGILTENKNIKEYLVPILTRNNFPYKDYVNTHIKPDGYCFLGFIYSYNTIEKKNEFQGLIKQALNDWKNSEKNILRINCIENPISLDPRIGGDEYSKIPLKVLFEGLMNVNSKGLLENAIAKSVTISKDLKTYTFYLKNTYWSDGSKLIAYDFEYAWKKILSPGFNPRFTFVFDIIKNAKKANKGLLPEDKIGIKAINESILRVELENPSSYFLELTALTLFSPINHRVDRDHPNWPLQDGMGYICNGPYTLLKANKFKGYILKKNPLYSGKQTFSVEQIHINNSDTETALHLFKSNKIDYVQLSFNFSKISLAKKLNLKIENTTPVMQSRCLFNTNNFLFHNKKIRQAFNLSINRHEIIKNLKYDYVPTYSIFPYPIIKNIFNRKNFENLNKAKVLFKEGLKELQIKNSDFLKITLISTNHKPRNDVLIALKERWEKTFNIKLEIKTYNFSTLFNKIETGNFQLVYVAWVSVINDPIYTLDQFRYKNQTINHSNWESRDFQAYLKQSDLEQNTEKRLQFLQKAEQHLLKETPCIPIFQESPSFIKNPYINIAHDNLTGFLNLRDSCKRDFIE